MAKIELNPLIAGISGRMGDVVFKKSSKGTVFVARYSGKSAKEPSEAQKAHRLRFKEAAAYAKAALAEPDLRAHYEERATREGKAAYALAIADYMNGTTPIL